jgi:dolichol-phosphate mannosyltransferase
MPVEATETLSVVIPAHNESGCLLGTVEGLLKTLEQAGIPHEIVLVDDHSTDGTGELAHRLAAEHGSVVAIENPMPNGFGFAVRAGLNAFSGDAVAVFMADASDDPDDLVRFFRKMQEGYDCVFGTRWRNGGKVYDYPWPKHVLNRLANHFVRLAMQLRYDDVTNAFKLYRREVIDGCRPFLSHHFNLTVELPLKAIIRGYSYTVLPNSWTNRKTGVSKLKIKEMGSRYLFIVLYCFIEKWLACGDYRQDRHGAKAGTSEAADGSAEKEPDA